MILRTLSLDALKRWMGEKAKGGKKLKKERKHWDYFPSKKKNSKPIILRHRVEMLSQLKTVFFFSLCVCAVVSHQMGAGIPLFWANQASHFFHSIFFFLLLVSLHFFLIREL